MPDPNPNVSTEPARPVSGSEEGASGFDRDVAAEAYRSLVEQRSQVGAEEISAIVRALVEGDDAAVRRLVLRLLVIDPSNSDILLFAAQVSVRRSDIVAADRFVGASHAAHGRHRDIRGVHLSIATSVGTYAAQSPEIGVALRLLRRLCALCRNNLPLVGLLVSLRFDHLDLKDLSPVEQGLVESLIASQPSETTATHLMKAALRSNRTETGLEILWNSGLNRNFALKSGLIAAALEGGKLGRAAYFHPEPEIGNARQFYVIAPAKSASIFVAHTLADLFGFPLFNLSFSKLTSDNLDLDSFFAHLGRSAVLHQHTPATTITRAVFSDFDIRPLVPIRNVFDTLVSLRDWRMSMNYKVDRYFVELEPAAQFNVLMLEEFPKLLRFFTTWHRAIRSGAVKGFMVDSQTLVQRPAYVIQKYLSALHDIQMDLPRIETVLDATRRSPRKANFNPKRGKRLEFGVGYEVVPQNLIAMARTSYLGYPDVDFTMFDPAYRRDADRGVTPGAR